MLMDKTYSMLRNFTAKSRESKQYPMLGFGATMVLLVATCAIYGIQFDYLAPDDVFFRYTERPTYSLALANYVNGRFIPGAAYHLFSELDWQIHKFWLFLQPFTYLAFSIFSYVFISNLCRRSSWSQKVICSVLILSFPYLISIFINKNNQLNALICFASLAATIHFFSNRSERLYTLAASIFLFIAFASYQTLTYYFIIFIIGKCLFEYNISKNTTTIIIGTSIYITVAALYYVLYGLISSWALLEMMSTANDPLIQFYGKLRSSSNDLFGLFESLKSYTATIVRVLIAPEPILPIALKVFAMNFLAIAFFVGPKYTGTPSCNYSATTKRNQRIIIFLLVLLLSSPIHLFIENNWYSPRVLAHVGAIWAIICLFVVRNLSPVWAKLATIGVAVYGAVLCFYVANTNQHIQQLAEKDQRLALKIMDEIREADLYGPSKPVAIIGLLGPNTPYMSGITTYFEINNSWFAKERSKYGALQTAADAKIVRPSPEFLVSAQKACKTQPKSGQDFQTLVVDHGAIVCLEN